MATPKLEAKITANTRDFNSKMKNVRKSARGMSSAFRGIGGILAGALTFTAIKSFASELDDIGKAADRLGVSTDAIQKFGFAAKITGAEMGNVEKAIRKMTVFMFDAQRKTQTTEDVFKALGITFEELKGLKPEEQFTKLAEAINKIPDKSKQMAVLQKVFGRSGADLSIFLEQFKKLGDELESRGGIINEKTIRSAENFNDSLTKITTSLKAMIANSGALETMVSNLEVLANPKGFFDEIKKAKQINKKFGAVSGESIGNDILTGLFGIGLGARIGGMMGLNASPNFPAFSKKELQEMKTLVELKKTRKIVENLAGKIGDQFRETPARFE